MGYSNTFTNDNDSIIGTSGNDWLYGGGGNDFIFASIGRDRLEGSWGNDILIGGDGDIFDGGRDRDIMIDNGVNVWDRDTFVFNEGDTGRTTATADLIIGFTQFDRLDVPQSVVNGPHSGMVSKSVDSVEDAVSFAITLDKLNGKYHNTAYLFSNVEQETSYLVMDMDGRGSYESAVVMKGTYSTKSEWVDGFLDAWLV